MDGPFARSHKEKIPCLVPLDLVDLDAWQATPHKQRVTDCVESPHHHHHTAFGHAAMQQSAFAVQLSIATNARSLYNREHSDKCTFAVQPRAYS